MIQTSVASASVRLEQTQLLSKSIVPLRAPSTSGGNDGAKKKMTDDSKKRSCLCQKCHSCTAATSSVCREINDGFRAIDLKRRIRKTFSLQTLNSCLPFLKWLPKYRPRDFQGDLIAGITVGLTVIPQSLAYAKIAELPPQYGLYTAFMCCFVYVILGTSRDVNFGPAAVMSLLTAEFAHGNAALATFLAFVCGVIQVAMGVFRIGFVIEYISHPVINSFTIAAAITIACSQIKKWLGLRKVPREFVQQFYWTLRKLPETKVFDFLLGLGCMILLYVMKRLKTVNWKTGSSSFVARKLAMKITWFVSTARNAIVVIFSAVLAAILLHHDLEPFSLTGNITSGIPPFRPPEFTITTDNSTMSTTECFEAIGIGILIVPLVGVIEAIAIGKAFGRKNGYSIDGNQELLASGVANVLGSFVSAYPVSASFSRSAVVSQSGVRTTAANLFSGALVLLALAFLMPLFYYIPDAALAAVIIMAVVDMIDFSMIKHLWIINKADLLPWIATFFVSLLAGFEYGILIGVATSLLLLLYPWARPDIQANLVTHSEGETEKQLLARDVIIISIPMGLMFPGVDYLQEKVEASAVHAEAPATAVILDVIHVFKMDYTAVMGIKELFAYLGRKETPLVLINVQPSVLQQLQKAKITDFCYASNVEEALQLISDNHQMQNGLLKIVTNDEESIVHRSLSNLNNGSSLVSATLPSMKEYEE